MQQKSLLNQQQKLNNFNYLNDSLAVLNQSWQHFLLDNCYEELFAIDKKLDILSEKEVIYPPRELIFNALYLTRLENVRVVILGQDPYHGEGEANGLAFSVNAGIKLPPSLRNIYKELEIEYDISLDVDGEHLVKWARDGVLLLNSSLTVIKDTANSLSKIGWSQVSDKIISYISTSCQGIVFILWGKYAEQKLALIDKSKHEVLIAPHPSPFSAHKGFFGCDHFRQANLYLAKVGKLPIKWI